MICLIDMRRNNIHLSGPFDGLHTRKVDEGAITGMFLFVLTPKCIRVAVKTSYAHKRDEGSFRVSNALQLDIAFGTSAAELQMIGQVR